MKKFTDYLKANKKKVITRTIIVAGVVTTVIVVGALYKNGTFADDLAIESLEDGSILLTPVEA